MIYAKSNPKETLREHTDALRKELETLKNCYGDKIEILTNLDKEEFWRLLDIIVEFHDLGKVFTPFQNVIREKIGEKKIDTSFENDIYHNFISPAFINYKKLNIDNDLKEVIVQSIGYHHERDVIIDNDLKDKIQKILDEDILNQVNKLKDNDEEVVEDKLTNNIFIYDNNFEKLDELKSKMKNEYTYVGLSSEGNKDVLIKNVTDIIEALKNKRNISS